MKRLRLIAMLALAFGAGALVSRLPERAGAAAPVVATAIDLNSLTPADMTTNPALPNLRTKALALVDATQIAYSVGSAPKHTHANLTEIQLVLAGTGTEWLGDKQIAIAPGTFIVIPPNTPHAGLTGGPFKLFTVKTPPQDPTDYHPVP